MEMFQFSESQVSPAPCLGPGEVRDGGARCQSQPGDRKETA